MPTCQRMASLLCLLYGSLNAKHNPFPSTMRLFIFSNKIFRVLFLIAATSSSAIGRLILPIDLRHGIGKVKSRNVFIAKCLAFEEELNVPLMYLSLFTDWK